jgi:predicted DCC family thiol-disulfide oxidoreductase YuxK
VNTEITVIEDAHGWIFFDASCRLCAGSAARANRWLERHGFHLVPLQTPGSAERVGVTADALFARMHLLTRDGRRFAGADAFVEIARHLWWARPLAGAASFPAANSLLHRCYDWIAANRYGLGGTCRVQGRHSPMDWLPLLVLPIVTVALRGQLAGWAFMWTMALALYAGCKWLTYRRAAALETELTSRHILGYLLGWVGMDPTPFTKRTTSATSVPPKDWLIALMRVVLGTALVWGGVRLLHTTLPLAAGWVGMFGVILLLHFGLLHLLALAWRCAGVPVEPLMRSPLLATSLGDFWGARWNTGFHRLAHDFVFRPLRRLFGKATAVLVVFLVSGLVHELVITLPACGGYGLPTMYFLLQGLGLLFERRRLGMKLGLAHGIRGRAFALLVAAAPAFWLFPPVFVRNVILPMLHAIGAT